MSKTVYYLPGWGGRLSTGLGQALTERGYDLAGRETRGDFKEAGFTAQVQMVAEDLVRYFWSADSKVIANSFGGYLFLHAQSRLEPFPGNVILLSPIVGAFDSDERDLHFVPPYAELLPALIESGKMPTPLNIQIHTGELDWQSTPQAVKILGQHLGIDVHIVSGAGHNLPKEYVSKLLDGWC